MAIVVADARPLRLPVAALTRDDMSCSLLFDGDCILDVFEVEVEGVVVARASVRRVEQDVCSVHE